jgi:hypothetical protein
MKRAYIRFLIQLILFSLVLGVVVILAWFLLPSKFITPALPFMIPFYFSLSILIQYILLKGIDKKLASFVNRYMLITVVKLFLLIAVIIIYVFTNKQDALQFMITFFIFYLCYTVFEVVSILRLPK